MANLGIKVDDNEKEAFVALCSRLGKTQPEMISLMIQAMDRDEADLEQVPLVIALRKSNQAAIDAYLNLEKELESVQDKHSEETGKDKKYIAMLEDAAIKLEESLDKYEKDGEPINDLTNDVKELAALTVVRGAIHRCVKQRYRIQFKSADISEQDAVDSFCEAYKA